jgi:peptidoglycan-associated lipoprotein
MYRLLVRPVTAGAVLVVAAASACSYVGREDFDTTVADIRSEMSAQDQRISASEAGVADLQSDLEGLRASLDELRDEFQVVVSEFEDGIRFATPVHFDFDSAEIRPEDVELLDRFAGVVSGYYSNSLVTVEGFADPAGSTSYNLSLSQARAETVASYLASSGSLDGESVRAVGYGETRPVIPGAKGPGDEGLENRRVSFVIDFGG